MHRRVSAADPASRAPRDRAGHRKSGALPPRSRAVRRATVDAIADVDADAVVPLLERALRDRDGWVRWKAVRALADRGHAARRPDAVRPLLDDPDFRVRLEAARALAG